MANDTTMGTGAEALAAERMSDDRNEPCRVRRLRDGWYLNKTNFSHGNTTHLYWLRDYDRDSYWPRYQAAFIANAMIALTGNLGIEIEPV
jgi:hypothetical protein